MQYFALRGLRIPEIHHLVQQFIDNNKVVPNTLFFQLLEILGEDFDDLVEEEEDLGGVGVSFREGEEVEIVVSYVEVLLDS